MHKKIKKALLYTISFILIISTFVGCANGQTERMAAAAAAVPVNWSLNDELDNMEESLSQTVEKITPSIPDGWLSRYEKAISEYQYVIVTSDLDIIPLDEDGIIKLGTQLEAFDTAQCKVSLTQDEFYEKIERLKKNIFYLSTMEDEAVVINNCDYDLMFMYFIISDGNPYEYYVYDTPGTQIVLKATDFVGELQVIESRYLDSQIDPFNDKTE